MIFYTKPETKQSETIKLTYNKDTKMMEGYYEVTDTSESGEWKVNYIIDKTTTATQSLLQACGAMKRA